MSGQAEPAVRVDVLGQLRAWHGETPLSLGPLQQRVVLAVLALHANRPVGREQLIEAIWGSSAPTYAVNLLQKHVSGLRRVLEPIREARTPSQVLTWTDAGYLLTLPPGGLDLEVFDREVGRARAARAGRNVREAAKALHAALELWRGPAFEGLSSPLLDAQRDRLAERRIGVVEERIELDLAVGDDRDLVAELRQLVVDHPLRERLRGLLMMALYRSGRQAEALAAFREAHRYLLDELGVEPTAELQELHQRILVNDLSVAAPAAAAAAGSATGPQEFEHKPPTPAQLPYGMPDFSGREAELARLDALLASDNGDAGRAVVITAIAGTAGVGKTSLAVHWAHQVSRHFPDGQLYVNLRGFDPDGAAMEPAEAIRGFLDAFAVPSQRIPVTLDAQAALYRSLLAGRRVLVVLDNARDTDQVSPLLPGSPGCLVVVTSRNRLSGLVAAGAHPLAVDLLSTDEARELLIRRIGKERVAAEPEAVDDIIAACAGLPLALSIVAARAAVHPQFTLGALTEELREARGGLDAFMGESAATDVRAVFSWSYRTLSAEAALLFRLLGLHPGPHVTAPAAASLVGVPPARVRRLLAELVAAHLLEERTPGRFTFHDLLRAYATEQVHAVDTEAERHAAIGRLLDHYLHAAYAAERMLYPDRQTDEPPPPRPGVAPVPLVDPDRALAWFTAEHPVLLAAVEVAAGAGLDGEVWQLAWTLTHYLNFQGHWHDWAACLQAALAAARRLSDQARQADAHRVLALAYLQLCRFDDAYTHAQRALDLFQQLGKATATDQARAHLGLSFVLEQLGHHADALHHAERALDLYRATGNRTGESNALNWIGWYNTLLGHHESALSYCKRSLDLKRELGDPYGEAEIWNTFGHARHQLGQLDEAITCYERALRLWRQLNDPYEESRTLLRLGEAWHTAADSEAARAAWQQALDILDQLGHPTAEHVRARLYPTSSDRS